MKIIDQSWTWEQKPDADYVLRTLEAAGRTCYKSEDKIMDGSAEEFVKRIVKRGHGSVLEHINVSFRIVTDRGVTHELVRHRLASYSQESTRYCNYSKDKFGNELTFIRPVDYEVDSDLYADWLYVMGESEDNYFFHIKDLGAKPEQARNLLPHSTKTEIVCTTNIRQWMHIFNLRTSKAAHPQIRALMTEISNSFYEAYPFLKSGE